MGAAGTLFRSSMAFALCSFVLGLIAVGILTAITYHSMSGLFESWRKDAEEYLADKTEWKTLIDNDKQRTGEEKVEIFLAYFSFACFIAGVIVGLISFFTK